MGFMGFDCITNIFRDLFRPFRERKRKKMESHKAINNSLTTMVSEIDLSERGDKSVKQHRKKKIYDSESNNVSYLSDKKNKRKEKSKTSLKMYNSSEEETSAQDNVYESSKSDKQSVYEDTESVMSEIEKVSRKRSKTKIDNKKSKKEPRDADKISKKSANKIKLKAVSRERNRSKEHRDLDSDFRDYKGSKAHKKKATKYAESSTTCYSSVSQNEKSTNSDSRDSSSTQNDDMSKERRSDNIMSSESIEYKKKNKKINMKKQRSDSVSDDILNGYEHDNKSSDYFDVLKNKANDSEYVNVLENYDKQNLEDIYDINQQIYDKLTEYLSRNLKP